MPARNDIRKVIVIAAVACLYMGIPAHGQVAVDKPLHLARVAGYVVNTAGTPVVDAEVTLDRDGTVAQRTRTDRAGAFHFDHIMGHYWFRVARTQNAPAVREIQVGDLIESYLERKKLYVIVGPGACADACSSIFTSKSEFEKAIKNKNRH